MRTLLATAALLTALVAPAAARASASCAIPSARGGGITELSASAVNPVKSETSSAVNVCGTVVVAFHGDPVAGCAAMGECNVSGEIGYDTRGAAELLAERTSRTSLSGSIESTSYQDGSDTPQVVAQVTRTTSDGVAHLCVDTGSFTAMTILGTVAAPLLNVFPFPSNPALRCAGPLASDIAGALPDPNVAGLLRSGGVLDLSGVRSFSAHGFSGTVTSTLALGVGRPRKVTIQPESIGGYGVEAIYSVTGLDGTITTDVANSGGGSCAEVDACGLQANLVDTAAATHGELVIGADVSARDRHLAPLQQLATASSVYGVIEPDGGVSLAAEVTRPGEPQPCVDSVSGLSAYLEVAATRSRGIVQEDAVPTDDLLRSRCPGPSSADLASDTATVFPGTTIGSPTVSQLARRTITLHLDTVSHVSSADGYSGTITPVLTLTARLRSIHTLP